MELSGFHILHQRSRGLKNIMHFSIKKDNNCSEWETIHLYE
ncbi:hypothetical protein ZOSMA_25G00010 [Zostera marina]|uniref:Uncharacterized protein n=1 Tax=Zostera marina TaxID=29655 RepID=A0A0K9PEZ6_ZOSMR|nr:hypothetical protein ZOSMA_25G00010 [Zostera marina]